MGLKKWYELCSDSKERLKESKDYEIVDIGETTLVCFAGFIMCLVSMAISVGLNSIVGAVFSGIIAIILLMAHFRGRDSIYVVEKEWK